MTVVAVIVWATCIERFWFAIRKTELKVLPKGAKDIIVLHISDVHLAPWQKYKQRWIKKLNSKVSPDLVIDTGDNLGHRNAVDSLLNSFGPFKGVPGVFVNGSNDLYAPSARNPIAYLLRPSDRHRESDHSKKLDTGKLNNGFESLGWLNLNNQVNRLTVNGTALTFIGTDDPHEARDDISGVINDLKLSDETIIGITHAPYLRVLGQLQEAKAAVVFAGHTHGGQVCWPFLGRALVTNCDLPTKYARGLNQIKLNGKALWINVCAGLGHSIYAPVRLACRPEVRVVTLKAKD